MRDGRTAAGRFYDSRRAEYREEQKIRNGRQIKRRRRGSLFLLYLMLIMLITATMAILSLTVFFRAEEITVSGETRYTDEAIITASGLKTTDNLFLLRGEKARQSILACFPYMEKVTVDRRFPSSVVITVAEAVPAFQMEMDGQYLLASEHGRILETGLDKPAENVMLVKGISISGPMAGENMIYESENTERILDLLMYELNRCGYSCMTTIDMSRSFEIMLLYQNRLIIKVGSAADLDYKLSYGKRIIDQEISAGEAGTLDLSRLSPTEKGNAVFHALN